MSLGSRLGDRFKAEFVGQSIATISSAALTVVLARLLDPEGYGLLFLAISVLSLFKLLSMMGIAKSGARFIAEYKEENPSQVPHIIKTSLVYNLVAIVLSASILLLAQTYIVDYLGQPGLTTFLLLGVFYLTFDSLSTYVRFIPQGFEEIERSALVHVLERTSRLLLATGFVLLGFEAIGAFAGYILGSALASVTGIAIIYKRFYTRYDSAPSIEPGLRRRIGEYMFPLAATRSANILDKQVDTILIGFFINPLAVSYYVIGTQVVNFIVTPAASLGFSLSPSYGVEKAKGNVRKIARVYETSLVHLLALYIPAAVGLILVAEPTVELIFGPSYLGAAPVLQVLSLYAVLQAITTITSNGLDYLGRARERAIVKVTTSVLNVLLNILLLPIFGVIGAAYATVATHSLYSSANLYIIHQEFDLRIKYLCTKFLLVSLVSLAMAGVVFVTVDYIESLVTLGLVVLLGVCTWCILSYATGLLELEKIKSGIL